MEDWCAAIRRPQETLASATTRFNTFVPSPDLFGAGSPVTPTKVYIVRPCYVDLAEEILPLLNVKASESSRPRAANAGVYGTPGVGKSIFASWLVSVIGASSPGSTIFYFSGSLRENHGLQFGPDGSVLLLSSEVIADRLYHLDHYGNELVWLVADGIKPSFGLPQPYRNLRVIVVHSANLEKLKWLHEWDKRPDLRTFLMPPFSEEEISKAAAARRPVQVGSFA